MIKIKGIQQVKNNLLKIKNKLINQARDYALRDLGEKIGELSSDKVPVEFGILKSTFVVKKLNTKWVAGYNTEYASYQHQGMRKNGTRIIRNRKGGGQSFFLSEPIQTNRAYLLAFFSQRFNHYLNNI